jgi:hypothetical protein
MRFGFFPLLIVAGLLSASPLHAEEKWLEFPGGEGPGKGKRVVLLSGDEEYRSEEAMPQLAKILSKHHGFDCVVLFSINPDDGSIDPDNQTNIPGIEMLAKADLVLMSWRFRELPDEAMKYFVDYVESGKPVIGLRTSTHAFNYGRNKTSPYAKWGWTSGEWKGGFGKQVLGETWVSHHGNHGSQSTRGLLVDTQKSNPILRGCGDIWGPTDVYGITKLPDTATPLVMGQILVGMKPEDKPLEGDKNNPMMPVAWTNAWVGPTGKTSRIFCTTMGAATDLESEGLRRLIVNASYWAVGLESQIPEKANVALVGDFKPTKFGFKAYVKGRKPADYK